MLQSITERLSHVFGGRQQGKAVPRSRAEQVQLYEDCVELANEQLHSDSRREGPIVAVSNARLNFEGCKKDAWEQIKLMQARSDARPLP